LFSSSFSSKKARENSEKALSTGFEPRLRLRTLFKKQQTKDKGVRNFARRPSCSGHFLQLCRRYIRPIRANIG